MAIDYTIPLVLSTIAARRSTALTEADRREVLLRGLAFASVGVPPAVGAVDATRQVRRIERRRLGPIVTDPAVATPMAVAAPAATPAPATPAVTSAVESTGQQVVAALTSAAAATSEQIAKAEDEIAQATEVGNAIKASIQEQKEAIAKAKPIASALADCAKEIAGLLPQPG